GGGLGLGSLARRLGRGGLGGGLGLGSLARRLGRGGLGGLARVIGRRVRGGGGCVRGCVRGCRSVGARLLGGLGGRGLGRLVGDGDRPRGSVRRLVVHRRGGVGGRRGAALLLFGQCIGLS